MQFIIGYIYHGMNLLQMILKTSIGYTSKPYNEWIEYNIPKHSVQNFSHSSRVNFIVIKFYFYRFHTRLSHKMLLLLNTFCTAYLPIFSIFGRNVSVYLIPSIALWMRVQWMIFGTILKFKWQQLSMLNGTIAQKSMIQINGASKS